MKSLASFSAVFALLFLVACGGEDGSGKTEGPTAPQQNSISNKIVFVSERDANDEIYVMNADGSGQTRLTNNSSGDRAPAWSPNGSKIAFSSNRGRGGSGIYVMKSDGSGQNTVTDIPASDEPAWSPDGAKIIFTSNRYGSTDIYVMNANGSGQTNLTNNPAIDNAPAWSPDGAKIAFTSDQGPPCSGGVRDERRRFGPDQPHQRRFPLTCTLIRTLPGLLTAPKLLLSPAGTATSRST